MNITFTSDTLTQGRITKTIMVPDDYSYADALLVMDNIVDEMDGLFEKITCPPDTLSFDEILSGVYGEFHNYLDRGRRWQIILKSGWFYTGDLGSDIGKRCDALNRRDPNLL